MRVRIPASYAGACIANTLFYKTSQVQCLGPQADWEQSFAIGGYAGRHGQLQSSRTRQGGYRDREVLNTDARQIEVQLESNSPAEEQEEGYSRRETAADHIEVGDLHRCEKRV